MQANQPTYTLTMANEFIPGGPSLDVVMVETTIQTSKRTRWHHNIARMDGSFAAWPLTFANCQLPRNMVSGKSERHLMGGKSPSNVLLSWLSAVLAGMTSQLHFRLFPFGKNIYMPPALQEYMIVELAAIKMLLGVNQFQIS